MTDAETIEDLRRRLADREAECRLMRMTLDERDAEIERQRVVIATDRRIRDMMRDEGRRLAASALVSAVDRGDVTVPVGPETPFLEAVKRGTDSDFPAWLERQRGKRDAE